jgi:hypothetical protein
MIDSGKSPFVVIILVNWNSSRDTLECVDSIMESSYNNFKIIVVDNGSVDDSVARLKDRENEYQLILSRENTGFTGGNNLGMESAMHMGADYVFLLNNDTLIEKSAIEKLVFAAQNDMSAGVVTPKIYFHPDRHLIWAAGSSYNQGRLMAKNLGYKFDDRPEYNQRKYLDYAVGCALLIRRDVIESIGMLTEDYFATWEDVDFGLKVNLKGYKVLYEPSSIVWHKESVSAGGADNPQYVYYQTRSAFVFQYRWSQSLFNSFKGHSYYFAYCMLRMTRFLISKNFRGIAAIFIAIFDALTSRLGRRNYSILQRKRKIN